MPASPIVLILMVFGLTACAFALLRGGRAERIAALLILANLVLGYVTRFAPPGTEPIFRLANDGVTAFAFLGVTLRHGSPWLGGVMLFYAAQFTLHSVYFVADRPRDFFHSLANNVDFLGIHLCLVAGTVLAWRRAILDARRARQAPAGN